MNGYDRRLILFLNKIHFLFHLGSIVKTFTIDAHALWIYEINWNVWSLIIVILKEKLFRNIFKKKFKKIIFNIKMSKQFENIKNLIKKNKKS